MLTSAESLQYYFDKNTTLALADAVHRLLTDTTFRAARAKSAWQRVCSESSVEATVSQLTAKLRSTL